MPERGGDELTHQVMVVCKAYLGQPMRLEGTPGTAEERAVWRCTECGGDFVATISRAGCEATGCPAPHDADAFDLVAHHCGLHGRKDYKYIIQITRDLVAKHHAAIARARTEARRRAEERTRAVALDREERVGEDVARRTPATASSGVPAEERIVKNPQEPTADELREFRSYREIKKREQETALKQRERDSHERELRKARVHHEELLDRAVAARAWSTPQELAEAACLTFCVVVCLWIILTGLEAGYDFAAELLGAPGIPDHEVGRLEVGQLHRHAPEAYEPPPRLSLRGHVTEAWREHHRLVLASLVGTTIGLTRRRSQAGERQAKSAFSPNECLILRRGEGEG